LLALMHTFDVVQAPLVGARYVLEWVLNVGWVGVQLFFVLSGFLITRILLATRSSENYYAAFFGRRALRILPLYYATLLVALLLSQWFGDATEAAQRGHSVFLWLFLVNWSEPLGYGVASFPHFWSLAVEEQFYLVWPLIVRVWSPGRLLQFCGAVMLVALLARIAILAAGYGPQAAYMFTVCRMDALAAGAATAVILTTPHYGAWLRAHLSKLFFATIVLVIVGVVITRGYSRTGYWTQTLGYSILAWACAVLVLVAASPKDEMFSGLRRAFVLAPLRACGRVSYGMYVFGALLHIHCGMRLLQGLSDAQRASIWLPIAYGVSAIVATYILAVVSYHLFEKRMLALKRFFVPKPVREVMHAAP
jgi:peptidoglycan/LPS O-acetylase OafA/YrhL